MKLKRLKRANPMAWRKAKQTLFAQHMAQLLRKLYRLAIEKAGDTWKRVGFSEDGYYMTVYCKQGEEPRPVPAGEAITVIMTEIAQAPR